MKRQQISALIMAVGAAGLMLLALSTTAVPTARAAGRIVNNEIQAPGASRDNGGSFITVTKKLTRTVSFAHLKLAKVQVANAYAPVGYAIITSTDLSTERILFEWWGQMVNSQQQVSVDANGAFISSTVGFILNMNGVNGWWTVPPGCWRLDANYTVKGYAGWTKEGLLTINWTEQPWAQQAYAYLYFEDWWVPDQLKPVACPPTFTTYLPLTLNNF